MELNIDPDLSVYRLTERVRKQSALLNHRLTMSVLSREIEDATLLDGARTRIFSSFQRMSRFIPQIPRYRLLAQQAEIIYVFGIPDIELPEIEKVVYIPLRPTDQLAREWFIVSYGQDYATMLATEEQTHIDDPDNLRQFRGLWTFEATLTGIVAEWLTRVVNARPIMFAEADHDTQAQNRYITRIKQRLDKRLTAAREKGVMTVVQTELTLIMNESLPHNVMINSLS